MALIQNFAEGHWRDPQGPRALVHSALTGEVIAETGSGGLNFGAMVKYARRVSGSALRSMTFHDRAAMLNALAQAVIARKEELYALAIDTGATRADNWIEIEGGAGTRFAYLARGPGDPMVTLSRLRDWDPLARDIEGGGHNATVDEPEATWSLVRSLA